VSLAFLAIDIDIDLYFFSIIYSLLSTLDSLDESILSQLTSTSIKNTMINNETFSRDLESPSSNSLAIGENFSFIRTRAIYL
jgi:hypothetical protein